VLKAKTVLVVGAGASSEVGLPVGGKLKDSIHRLLDFKLDQSMGGPNGGNGYIYDVLCQQRGTGSARLKSAARICNGLHLAQSIDDFVDTHQADDNIVACAKLAIVTAILEAERKSKLFFTRSQLTINSQKIQDTWYIGFFRLLSQSVKVDAVADIFSNLSVICFNYDRCIEHFLVHALSNLFLIKLGEASELVSKMTLFRPYGVVADYFEKGERSFEFGAEVDYRIQNIASNVKTYSEQLEDQGSLVKMQKSIAEAETLVFLGNAYHMNNLRLLYPKIESRSNKKIYATRLGISNEDIRIVDQRLSEFYNSEERTNIRAQKISKVLFADSCSDLFSKYRLSLPS
jgi:hypothetical protein